MNEVGEIEIRCGPGSIGNATACPHTNAMC